MIVRLWHGAVPLERARYYPEDADPLLEMEPRVIHYEVLASPEG